MLDGKIILVDDNEAVLKTLKMILAREFKTLVGVSVPTLLPALLREGDVDIVLLDMNFVTGRQDGSGARAARTWGCCRALRRFLASAWREFWTETCFRRRRMEEI